MVDVCILFVLNLDKVVNLLSHVKSVIVFPSTGNGFEAALHFQVSKCASYFQILIFFVDYKHV